MLSHRKGESVIAVDTDPAIVRNGRALTAVTVVNDNMPFLFNSVLGEITDTAGEPTFVTHPVIGVRHGKKGVSEIIADGGKIPGVDRLSVIHIHINALSADEANGLNKRLGKVLTQVRAAVGDWKPMLARLDRAISEFRYQPIPLAKDAVAEAIAFLEWLRDDNFTFLGMREFRYSGGEKTGSLARSSESRSGHPRRSRRQGAAPRRGRGHHARDSRLPLRPRSADRDQGKRQVDRASPRLSRLRRHQDIRQEGRVDRRTARRRPLHLDRIHALGDEDPLSQVKGRDRHPQVGLRSRTTIPARR